MSFLLSVTFACGVVIAVSHVINRGFIAPVYDVVANLTAFACAIAASLMLGHYGPALLSSVAILCWLALARRTFLARRGSLPTLQRQPSDPPARPSNGALTRGVRIPGAE